MPTWLLTPTGILSALLAAVSIYGVVVTKMYGGANDRYHTLKAQVEQVQRESEAEVRRIRAEQEKILANYGNGWSAALDAARAKRLVRVLPRSNSAAEAGALPAAACKPHEEAIEHGLSTATTVAAEECEARLNNAVIDAAQVLWLEQWIIDQHEASK